MSPVHSDSENDAGDLGLGPQTTSSSSSSSSQASTSTAGVAGPSSSNAAVENASGSGAGVNAGRDATSLLRDALQPARKKRKILHERSASEGDRFIAASGDSNGPDPSVLYKKGHLDHANASKASFAKQSGAHSLLFGAAAQTQNRYDLALSTLLISSHGSNNASTSQLEPTPTSRPPKRRLLAPLKLKLFSYFSSSSSQSSSLSPEPSSPSRRRSSIPSLARTRSADVTSDPNYRRASLSNDTISALTEETRAYRNISHTPYKVLDAPLLEDNFYLNLLDWGKNDLISVALKNAVYLYDVKSSSTTSLDIIPATQSSRFHASALRWIGDGSTLAWANRRGDISIYNSETKQKTQTFTAHLKKIGVLDTFGNLIASGSEDCSISIRDLRSVRPVTRINAHSHEVCGLKWSAWNEPVLASGGNDNKLFIWDLRNTTEPTSSSSSSGPGSGAGPDGQRTIRRGRLSSTPASILAKTSGAFGVGASSSSATTASVPASVVPQASIDSTSAPPVSVPLPGIEEEISIGAGPISLGTSGSGKPSDPSGPGGGPLLHLTEHRAAVRGLAWSPHTRGLLASGGGRQDPIIRFWNTALGHKIDQVECHAQVTNLHWSSTTDELLSTHGFPFVPPNTSSTPANAWRSIPGIITVWHYPTRVPNISFAAHSGRVSYLAVSPAGDSVLTAAGDETLRFFNLFPRKSEPVNRTAEEMIGRVR